MNHISSQAREITFAGNEDIIKGVQWVSTLDARTTEICMSLDGQVFSIGEGPRPPAHVGCRSSIIPVLKSWKELGINLKEAPPGTRASMDGQVADTVTYPDWLKDQPASVQDEALGPARAELFRDGVPIERFVDDRFNPLTLDQIKTREGLE